jgi:hypothetical protein
MLIGSKSSDKRLESLFYAMRDRLAVEADLENVQRLLLEKPIRKEERAAGTNVNRRSRLTGSCPKDERPTQISMHSTFDPGLHHWQGIWP